MSEPVYQQRDPQNTPFYLCVGFGEWLCGSVVKAVPQRHVVFGIPKILRRNFLYDRKLRSVLSRCAWEAVSEYLQAAASSERLRPAAVNAIQTFGDFLGYKPHCQMLLADSGFHENGALKVAPAPDGKQIAELFPLKAAGSSTGARSRCSMPSNGSRRSQLGAADPEDRSLSRT